jgi:hypothetical protein
MNNPDRATFLAAQANTQEEADHGRHAADCHGQTFRYNTDSSHRPGVFALRT